MSDRDLARADLLLLLAELLDDPACWPAAGGLPSAFDVGRLAATSGLDAIDGGAVALGAAVEAWRRADRASASAERGALFDGPLTCPANETIFVRRDKGAVLADIAGFYRAFGFELAESFGEKHDHLRAELQFVAMLHVLSARATNDDERSIAADAAVAFLRDHLGLWLGPFAARLEAAAFTDVTRATAVLLAATWAMLARDAGLESLTLDPVTGPLALDDGTPYECGMCPGEPS